MVRSDRRNCPRRSRGKSQKNGHGSIRGFDVRINLWRRRRVPEQLDAPTAVVVEDSSLNSFWRGPILVSTLLLPCHAQGDGSAALKAANFLTKFRQPAEVSGVRSQLQRRPAPADPVPRSSRADARRPSTTLFVGTGSWACGSLTGSVALSRIVRSVDTAVLWAIRRMRGFPPRTREPRRQICAIGPKTTKAGWGHTRAGLFSRLQLSISVRRRHRRMLRRPSACRR
jgi:hypothetical protein